MRKFYLLTLLAFIPLLAFSADRERLNFNGGWLMHVGDVTDGEGAAYNDASWKPVTLPRAFNEDEAFRVSIENLTDTVVWYRKHFTVSDIKRRKFFIEFEGVRFGADFWLNGHKLGISENGVMASGFDLTPYIRKGSNVIAVRTDNSWDYRERATGQRYQWNDKNFNANYGGIPKNVAARHRPSIRPYPSIRRSRPPEPISMAPTTILPVGPSPLMQSRRCATTTDGRAPSPSSVRLWMPMAVR